MSVDNGETIGKKKKTYTPIIAHLKRTNTLSLGINCVKFKNRFKIVETSLSIIGLQKDRKRRSQLEHYNLVNVNVSLNFII